MKKQLLIGILTIFIGGIIYLLFRTSDLRFFNWIERINLPYLSTIRYYSLSYTLNIPEWVVYSLPDGLWIFSYITLSLAIWKNKITKQNLFWILIIPIVIIIWEFCQLLNIIKGTFDLLDLILYFMGIIIPLIFFSNLITLKLSHYE